MLNILDHLSSQVCGDELLCTYLRITPVSHSTRPGDEGCAPFSTHICGSHCFPPPRLPIATLFHSHAFLRFLFVHPLPKFRQCSAVVRCRLLHVLHRLGQSRHLVLEFRRLLAKTTYVSIKFQRIVVRMPIQSLQDCYPSCFTTGGRSSTRSCH